MPWLHAESNAQNGSRPEQKRVLWTLYNHTLGGQYVLNHYLATCTHYQYSEPRVQTAAHAYTWALPRVCTGTLCARSLYLGITSCKPQCALMMLLKLKIKSVTNLQFHGGSPRYLTLYFLDLLIQFMNLWLQITDHALLAAHFFNCEIDCPVNHAHHGNVVLHCFERTRRTCAGRPD